jgi:hypothetical protein
VTDLDRQLSPRRRQPHRIDDHGCAVGPYGLVRTEVNRRPRRVAEFADHYNQQRPHRSRGQLPPDASQQTPPAIDTRNRRLLRTRILGGAINEYRYAA